MTGKERDLKKCKAEFNTSSDIIFSEFSTNAIEEYEDCNIKPNAKIVWLDGKLLADRFKKSKKGNF